MDDILKAFPAVLKQLGQDNAAVEQLVFAAWRRSVDGAMARNVVPFRLERKNLVAAVSSDTWLRQVADLGFALSDRINRKLGMDFVKRVVFEVRPDFIEAGRNVRVSGPRTAEDTAAPIELQQASQAIADESLRRLFLSAASSSLSRSARRE